MTLTREDTFENVWDLNTDILQGDITLYAKWTVNSYEVSFNSNGGTSVSSQSIEYNSYASEPTAPIKAGYIFEGWYKDSALTEVWNFTTDKVTEATTLYAKWSADPSAPMYRVRVWHIYTAENTNIAEAIQYVSSHRVGYELADLDATWIIEKYSSFKNRCCFKKNKFQFKYTCI